jgi:polysaccharide biosynthesis transport protein
MNPPPLSSPPAKPSSRGCLLYAGIVIVTFLLVFFSACVVTYVMPKKFVSTAVVQVKPSRALYGFSASQMMTPQFFATEFEVIRANLTLKLVVEKLDLTTKWNMTEEEAVAILHGIVEAQNIRGTDLIQISVKHTGAEDARDIAKEVYEAYKKRREDSERKVVESSLKELDKAILDQSDVVEEKRKQRDNLLKRDSNSPEMEQTKQDVQKDYEVQKEMLDGMKEKLSMERISLKLTHYGSVILHEEPVVAQYPSSPNVTLNLAIGAGLGGLLGAILVLFVQLVRG